MHPTPPRLLILLCLVLGASIAHAADPFRIESKPPTLGYITHSTEPVSKDLLDVPMISQLAGVMGTIAPRSFSTLRRTLARAPVDPSTLSDANRIGFLHLERTIDRVDFHSALSIHQIDPSTIGLRSLDDPAQAWSLPREGFDRLGIRWASDPSETIPASDRFVLPTPHIQSSTVLDLKTVRARIKRSYPRLSRTLSGETFRVRLPKDHKPDFPAGVLVWISPSIDGRIPTIFEPIADRLGLIVIGIDNNGNKRAITDRLQNHLDSIESLASHFQS